MVYSLAQWAKLEKNPLKKGILIGLAQEGLIADLMTWRSIGGLNETGVRFDSVPSPAFIPLDGTIAEATVDGHPLTHSVYRLAHHIDIPVPLEDSTEDLIAKPSQKQTKLALKGAAYVINDRFVNGDQGTDPNGFDGIEKLVGNLASGQTIGSTEIDLTASYTSAIGQSLIDLIHQGMAACEGHMPTAAFANSDCLYQLERVLRREQLLGNDYNWKNAPLEVDDPRRSLNTATSKPAFMYRGVPFYDLGFKADQSTKIIGNTYTEGGSTAHGTRIYFIKQGPEDLEGIQNDPLHIMPIGVLESKDSYRFRLLWTLGLALWGPRSIVKCQGIRAI